MAAYSKFVDRVYQIDFDYNFGFVHCCYLDVRVFREFGIYRPTGVCPSDSVIRSRIKELSKLTNLSIPISSRSTRKERLIIFISYLLFINGYFLHPEKSYRLVVAFHNDTIQYILSSSVTSNLKALPEIHSLSSDVL